MKRYFLFLLIVVVCLQAQKTNEQIKHFSFRYQNFMKEHRFAKARKEAIELKKQTSSFRDSEMRKIATQYFQGWNEELRCLKKLLKYIEKKIHKKRKSYIHFQNYRGKLYKGIIHKCAKGRIYLKMFGGKKTRVRLYKFSISSLERWLPFQKRKDSGKFFFAIGILYYYKGKKEQAMRAFKKAENHQYTSSYMQLYNFAMDTKEQMIVTKTHAFYIPGGRKYGEKYPLVIALAPNGDGKGMANIWKFVGEKNKWFVYGSKIHRNGVDMRKQVDAIYKDLQPILKKYPIHRQQIILTGFSGGGMCSHYFAMYRPKFVRVVMPNTGMIHRNFHKAKAKKYYPRRKVVVFLASPSDFRYKHMKQDKVLLESLQWKTHWIEFKGGHTHAPKEIKQKAADWIDKNIFQR